MRIDIETRYAVGDWVTWSQQMRRAARRRHGRVFCVLTVSFGLGHEPCVWYWVQPARGPALELPESGLEPASDGGRGQRRRRRSAHEQA